MCCETALTEHVLNNNVYWLEAYSFAALCRAGRAILGWSQADLAEKTKMATASVARIETGKINPRHDTVTGIIRALQAGGLSIDRYDIDGGFSITADKSLFSK